MGDPPPEPRPTRPADRLTADMLAAGHEKPRPRERWSALPRRARRAVLATAGLVLLAALTTYALAHRAEQPPSRQRPPAAYPAQTTRITFTGITHGSPGKRTFAIRLHITATSPVTIEHVTQGYEALDVRLDPPPPVTVTARRARELVLRAEITDCRRLPMEARMPFIDVTLRNSRDRQRLSVILGARYARDLTRVFRTVCGPTTAAPAPAP